MTTNPDGSPGILNTPLIALAGSIWASVGTMLMIVACNWLVHIPKIHMSLFAGAGIVMGLAVNYLWFYRIADKNISRIRAMDRRHTLFSFISWKSYLLIVVMMSSGALLRHSPLPRQHLSIVYICMGLALVLSSIRYFRAFFLEKNRGKV